MSRRAFLSGSGALLATVGLGACTSAAGESSSTAASGSTAATAPGHITNATAITQVYGDGQKLVAVALEYDVTINSSTLSRSAFKVAHRTITKVYANTEAAMSGSGRNGKFVVIEMALSDSAAALWPSQLASGTTAGPPSAGAAMPSGGAGMPPGGAGAPSGALSGNAGVPSGAAGGAGGGPAGGGPGGGMGATLKKATASVTQIGAVATVAGTKLPALATAVSTSQVINLVVDEFRQLSYTDPKTGATLKYNLFVPKSYSASKKYPLVLFMHDATVTGTDTVAAIAQGLGAVSWASPAAQAKQEAIVVAPLYSSQPVTDSFTTSNALDTTVDLVKKLSTQYSVDTSRLYSTGQSGGAMLSMAIGIKYPDLFAAMWIVAGQWAPSKVAPLATQKLWITVAAGDAKAYPYENKIVPILQKDGATVSRSTWNGKAGVATLDAEARAMAAARSSVNYTVFTKGTVEPAGASVNNLNEHLCTWRVAYTIDAIRDWVYQQRL